ncbi:salivary glue protein Sgs-3-like [Dermacentor silvarum]|uniref:salivary glue protein Sgs-3-like n=1 Tax=Dermacentor silvarum TaxID=543639 RepID=UPI00210161D7|nr:salivary glue protein Sgs-3-like [Dermacentor silvarum]
MRKGVTPAASARPSVQGGRRTPSPIASAWTDYQEERPSILSLYFVIFLTALLIGALVTALFFAYAHEVERRPPSTTASATTPAVSLPPPLQSKPPPQEKPQVTCREGASGRTSRRSKKRGRRKKTSTLPYTSSSSSSFEVPEGATTTAEKGRGRIGTGGGRPAVDTTKANTKAGTVSNASRSRPATYSVSRIARPRDEAGMRQSGSTERTTTTLDELANNTTSDATTITSAAATTPIAPLVERTEEDAAFGVGGANSTTRSDMIDEATARAGFEEEAGTGRDGGNETKAAVTVMTPPLEEWTELGGDAAVGIDSNNASGSELDDESTEEAAGLEEETGMMLRQADSAKTEATLRKLRPSVRELPESHSFFMDRKLQTVCGLLELTADLYSHKRKQLAGDGYLQKMHAVFDAML